MSKIGALVSAPIQINQVFPLYNVNVDEAVNRQVVDE